MASETAVVAVFGPAMRWWGSDLSSLPASPGYQSFFVKNGHHPIFAQMLAAVAVRHGERRARENKRTRSVSAAVQFLAKPNRQYRGIRSRAKILLAGDDEASIIGAAFSEAGLHEEGFLRLLKAVVDGRPEDRSRIAAIAAAVSPHLTVPRGRKVTAASAAYEFIRSLNPELAKSARRRHFVERQDEFIDPLAEATRLEFQDPTFSPRSARRRLKREKTRTRSERNAG